MHCDGDVESVCGDRGAFTHMLLALLASPAVPGLRHATHSCDAYVNTINAQSRDDERRDLYTYGTEYGRVRYKIKVPNI